MIWSDLRNFERVFFEASFVICSVLLLRDLEGLA